MRPRVTSNCYAAVKIRERRNVSRTVWQISFEMNFKGPRKWNSAEFNRGLKKSASKQPLNFLIPHKLFRTESFAQLFHIARINGDKYAADKSTLLAQWINIRFSNRMTRREIIRRIHPRVPTPQRVFFSRHSSRFNKVTLNLPFPPHLESSDARNWIHPAFATFDKRDTPAESCS